jgi:hypothetical protein
MKNDRDFERVTDEWLDAGSDSTPPHVIAAVLLAARNTPQERDFRVPWRTLTMRNPIYAVAVIAVVAVVGLAALYAFGPDRQAGSGPVTSPTEQPTGAPSPTPAASASPLDTTSWTAYESERYGWIIGHPADWSVTPAERDWTLSRDVDDVLSSGQEMFTSPDGHVRVSAWSVAVDPERDPMWVDSQSESWANVAAWAEEYCQAAGNGPCEGIIDRAVPLCFERRDCHPGLLVPFQNDVQAFFTGGTPGADMVVVAVWWGESAPAVASYGGSQRLLEAFLSTMAVWPESVPFEERQCFGEAEIC